MVIKHVLLGFTTNLLNLTDEIPDWVSVYQNTGLLLSYSCIFDWLASLLFIIPSLLKYLVNTLLFVGSKIGINISTVDN